MRAPTMPERPGSTLVIEALDVASTGELLDRHPQGGALDALACLVADTADEVDRLHTALLQSSDRAIEKLNSAAGDRHPGNGLLGILQSTGHDVELLSARRAALHTQLERTTAAYQRALTVEAAARATEDRNRTTTHGDDWTMDEALRDLLQRAKRGIRLQRGLSAAYLPDADATRPTVPEEGVRQLIADGTLTVKRSRHAELRLSLTAKGEATLRDIEAASRSAAAQSGQRTLRAAAEPTAAPAAATDHPHGRRR